VLPWAREEGSLDRRSRVPIFRLFQEASFNPEEIERMVAAYEAALKSLGLTDRADPLTELVVQKIIAIFRNGEHEPSRICSRALLELKSETNSWPGIQPPDGATSNTFQPPGED